MVYDINGNEISSVPELKRIRVLEYNIANFTGDGTYYGYNGNDLSEYMAEWAKYIGSTNADICLFAESRKHIDSDNTTLSTASLFSELYNYVNDYGNADLEPWRVAILTNVEQTNVIGNIFTHQVTDGGSKYIMADVIINGLPVKIITVHLMHGSEQSSVTLRAQQMSELIDMTQNVDNVIIAGDFNTRSLSELQAMKNAGFSFSNGGIWGEFLTQGKPTPLYPVDNICVKGGHLKIQNFTVDYDCLLSDHYPSITDIIVY